MKAFLSSAAMAIFAVASSAQAQTGYYCELKDTGGSRGGFIQSPVVVVLGDQQAQVVEPIGLFVLERPVDARVRQGRNDRLRLTWRVDGIPLRQGGTTTVSYSAALNVKALSFEMRGRVRGAINDESGKGTCRVLTEKELRSRNWLKR